VVFPGADGKIFLDASAEVRGQRRLKDRESAAALGAEAILREIAERDRRDQTREISPLAPAPDAVLIDTTQLTAQEVADRIAEIAAARRRGAGMEITPGNQ